MNIFIVNQNPESNYNDSEGEFYNYPTSIPNGKQVGVGDLLLFLLSSKSALKLNLGESRVTGIAKIDDITFYDQFEKQYLNRTDFNVLLLNRCCTYKTFYL